MVISNVRYGSYITTSKFVKECEIENLKFKMKIEKVKGECKGGKFKT
jgi:hypothetical protein